MALAFGKNKTDGTAFTEAMGMMQVGKANEQEVRNLAMLTMPTCGSCSMYGTANTMSAIAEALGLSLPGSALIPAVYAERFRAAQASGEKIVELVKKGITSQQILTFEAIQNAIGCAWLRAAAPMQ